MYKWISCLLQNVRDLWATTQTKYRWAVLFSNILSSNLSNRSRPIPFLPVGAAGVWRTYSDAPSWPSHTDTCTQTHTHTHTVTTQNHSCNASFPSTQPSMKPRYPLASSLFTVCSWLHGAGHNSYHRDRPGWSTSCLISQRPPALPAHCDRVGSQNASSIQIGGVNYCPWFNRVQRGARVYIEICWHFVVLSYLYFIQTKSATCCRLRVSIMGAFNNRVRFSDSFRDIRLMNNLAV